MLRNVTSRNIPAILANELEGAQMEQEHGTVFVFHQHDNGRFVLGHGATVVEAVKAAFEYWNG